MDQASIPALRRGIRRHFDSTRGAHVLLGPERVIVLDEIAFEIVALLDGKRSIAEISSVLAIKFEADAREVKNDVTEFARELVEKGLATV
jgi:pyrroloquinoline quinone biosynthesis protein D